MELYVVNNALERVRARLEANDLDGAVSIIEALWTPPGCSSTSPSPRQSWGYEEE